MTLYSAEFHKVFADHHQFEMGFRIGGYIVLMTLVYHLQVIEFKRLGEPLLDFTRDLYP